MDFYREFSENNGSCIGFMNSDNYDKWLEMMQNRHLGKNLPEGFVRENFYLCYEGEKLVGVYSFKFELTDYLLKYGGHVGYAVRPTEQGRHLATEILRHGLALAKDFGFSEIPAVCDEDNYPSEKVILKNGGVLQNTLFDPEENVTVKRYLITV